MHAIQNFVKKIKIKIHHITRKVACYSELRQEDKNKDTLHNKKV